MDRGGPGALQSMGSQRVGQDGATSRSLLGQFIVIHTVKGFGTVNKAEIDVFLELSCMGWQRVGNDRATELTD